ncbi:PAP2-domain-containing protein [Panus rudis PR-1116 ss-1]|nr:PAP2-domain-containing protein [Panus rudis PR-1116 ss-1]
MPNLRSLFLTRRSSGHAQTSLSNTRRRKLLLSYLPDWVITIGLAALFYAIEHIGGYKREFSLSDTSLRHTYAVHERIPNNALICISFVAPVVLLPLVNFFTVRSWWDLHSSWLGLVLGLALTGSITQITKITVGRPRPDVISRCIPPVGAVDPPFGLSTVDICTQVDKKILDDGWKSFPSGHSSLSFAGLGFLSFYLAGKVHLFDKRGHAPKAWLAITPLAGAALVAISRTMDYRHHWHDVLVGSLLGLAMSFFSYRQYYPSLASENSHKPYSPRIRAEQPTRESILPLHRSVNDGYPPTSHQRAESVAHYDTPFMDHEHEESDEIDMTVPNGTVPKVAPEHMSDVWKDREESPSQPLGGSSYRP